MKRLIILVLALLAFSVPYTIALAQLGSGVGPQRNSPRHELIPGDFTTYFGPIKPNAYGPGILSDATGRAFQWQPQDWPNMLPDASLKIQPNQWGAGVHADQYGRIVKPTCSFGSSMC